MTVQDQVSVEALVYPDLPIPKPGQVTEVAPGVLWMRHELPFVLNHINVWAIADGDGWTLVDTGMSTPEIHTHWPELLKGPLQGKPIKRVLVTHMHPDHIGMAGWLTKTQNCRLWMTRLEYMTCRVMVSDTGAEAPEDALKFYRGAGWDEESLSHYKTVFGNFGRRMEALPDSYRRVVDGETFSIGDHTWHVVVGRGHSPEHACYYCPDLHILISGDQVLPKITTNVSVIPVEPDANPLQDWMDSILYIERTVPDDVLVLPAHNTPFRGLHCRLHQLYDGHVKALDAVSAAVATPKRVLDLFPVLFRREIVGANLMFMATGETVAHLNLLIGQGKIVVTTDKAGVNWYQAK